MKGRLLTTLVMFLALVARLAAAQQAAPPVTKEQVLDLVKFGMDSTELAKKIKERGIDFEPGDDYVQALRSAGAHDVVIQAIVARAAFAQESGLPLTKDQVSDLVKFGMNSEDLVKRIKERGISFAPTEDYIETLKRAGAQEAVIQALRETKPLTREQIGKLVAGGVPSQRATALVKQHGIDFQPDAPYLDTLRLAGADDALITALREAGSAAMGELVVATSPNAEVYLDGALQGRADAHGVLHIHASRGSHELRVSQEGKRDFKQSVMVDARLTTNVDARLVEITAELFVGTSPGAEVYLDGAFRGRADSFGELSLRVAFGTHSLRVSKPGKQDFSSSISVSQQTTVVNAMPK